MERSEARSLVLATRLRGIRVRVAPTLPSFLACARGGVPARETYVSYLSVPEVQRIPRIQLDYLQEWYCRGCVTIEEVPYHGRPVNFVDTDVTSVIERAIDHLFKRDFNADIRHPPVE